MNNDKKIPYGINRERLYLESQDSYLNIETNNKSNILSEEEFKIENNKFRHSNKNETISDNNKYFNTSEKLEIIFSNDYFKSKFKIKMSQKTYDSEIIEWLFHVLFLTFLLYLL